MIRELKTILKKEPRILQSISKMVNKKSLSFFPSTETCKTIKLAELSSQKPGTIKGLATMQMAKQGKSTFKRVGIL